MKTRPYLFSLMIALLFSLSFGSVYAQQSDEEAIPPQFEHYTTIQRLDPASSTVFADGRRYYLQPNTRIWIDDEPATRAELKPDMIGLRVGIDTYEHHDRNLVTKIQVFEREGRFAAPAKDMK